jgi:hypothetical protein
MTRLIYKGEKLHPETKAGFITTPGNFFRVHVETSTEHLELLKCSLVEITEDELIIESPLVEFTKEFPLIIVKSVRIFDAPRK